VIFGVWGISYQKTGDFGGRMGILLCPYGGESRVLVKPTQKQPFLKNEKMKNCLYFMVILGNSDGLEMFLYCTAYRPSVATRIVSRFVSENRIVDGDYWLSPIEIPKYEYVLNKKKVHFVVN